MTEPISGRDAARYGRTVKFAISLPQLVADGTFDPEAFRTYLTRAEQLGFESAWTQEQVLGRLSQLAPTETMTYAAACTERLRLGCSVYVAPLHNPVHLAKSLSSLDQLSRGRLEVGLGVGGRARMLPAYGVGPDGVVARFNEQVRIMRALWSEPEVTVDGRFWQLDGAAMEPKTFQKPGPPLWFGGSQPAALRRTVRHADGFFGAGSSTTAQFAEQMEIVRRELDEQGRDPASLRVAKRVYVAVDEDIDRARRRLAERLSKLYARLDDLTGVAVFGPPDACVRGVQEVVAAGAELVLFTTMFDHAEQMERVAAEVMPHLG